MAAPLSSVVSIGSNSISVPLTPLSSQCTCVGVKYLGGKPRGFTVLGSAPNPQANLIPLNLSRAVGWN